MVFCVHDRKAELNSFLPVQNLVVVEEVKEKILYWLKAVPSFGKGLFISR